MRRRSEEDRMKDGYDAVQLGFVEFIKPKRVNKPMTGHFKKANAAPVRVLREMQYRRRRRRRIPATR